jgi:protein phosphatase
MTIVNEYASAAVSDRGLSENRPHNEDSFLELTEHGLFAVADGVGGAQAGEVASQMAVEILAEAFINMSANADPEETMRIALDRANEAIFQMSHDLPQLSSMATTIAALHVNGDIATIAHVGDSRVYRMDWARTPVSRNR